MKRARLSLGLLTGCVIAVLQVYACSDESLVAPGRGIQHDLEPVSPDSGAVLGVYALPTPPNNNVATPVQSTGITIPAGVPALITVTGKLTFTPNPQWPPCAGYPVPPLPGQSSGVEYIGPLGTPINGYYTVVVDNSHSTWTPQDIDAERISSFAGGPAVLSVGRGATYTLQCIDGYPGYLVSGTQTLVATALPPPVINVDKTTVVTGDIVTGTFAVSWTTDIDLYYSNWQWVADPAPNGGGATFVAGSCGWKDPTCRVTVHGDGHLELTNVRLARTMSLTAKSPTIHAAPAHLVLVVDSSHVASGSQVKFTARRGDGIRPVAVQSWVWTPHDSSPVGPLAVDCAGGDSLCVTTLQNTTPADSTGVTQTGTMVAVAYLGTAAESASVAVAVDRPVPGGGGGCGAPAMSIRGATTRSASHVGKSSKANAPRPMSCPPPPPTDSATLVVSVDKYDLYPRVRGLSVNEVQVPEREPDTAHVQASVTRAGSPLTGVPVTLRAEFLPNNSGHAHIKSFVRFEDVPKASTGPEAGTPLVGYFNSGTRKDPNITLQTNDSGRVSVSLVAGYMGGQAWIIASASIDGRVLVDTVAPLVTYKVPGLVNLKDWITSGVYWIGGTNYHPQGLNWYVQDSVTERLLEIAQNMDTTLSGQPLYVQYNDATLPLGGAFTVSPEPVVFEDPFVVEPRGHQSHNTGLDIDIAFCYAEHQGDDGQTYRIKGCGSGTGHQPVDPVHLGNVACARHGVMKLHNNNHYHIRFVGSNDALPSDVCP